MDKDEIVMLRRQNIYERFGDNVVVTEYIIVWPVGFLPDDHPTVNRRRKKLSEVINIIYDNERKKPKVERDRRTKKYHRKD